MPISTRGLLAQWVLVTFNALLSVYSLAMVVAITLRPCSSSSISNDLGAHAATTTCNISQLELFLLGFHLVFAALALTGAAVAYVGHIVLVHLTRGMLFVFAAIYLALAVYELAAVRPVTPMGPLELVVAVLTFAVGVPSGAVYERELRCDRRVIPDAFDSVLPSNPWSGSGLERTIRRSTAAAAVVRPR
ncbi:hypothetical protein PF005_g12189 [Phytophthora fragariae]|uniref:Uncharacterized protein n=1 Tax=Phytophthora fragariae TaxID=53985 RepID=A0A6A3S290_9STRA|nr:hypothetical protein PF003_g12381 [Phytophthora fragariae]KAE8935817.1 hypothetical protein PF009_g14238 [Phytophthora fragariae]KAE9106993.1 hypothetical protein PF010_g12441 [Phytophthora fragariae]KAE9107558.1 hypothetical protein PF007_g13001 [Phytophthora fragariae]KAE9143216.1 hypothetical protein PF006_g11747 [Phytophthora fragariae]